MTVNLVLLLGPLVLAAILAATAPSPAHPHRRPRAAVVRDDRIRRPRHARPSRRGGSA
ncbi:hypothetical protein ABT263_38085 [Kitasatospora sp. NPDC001603]|uniref:hypothetical protein n=1 Tax=Kitasatospora sp. NPDC001603 TaxID=3154388 RepID=UPI00332219B8